MYKKAIAFVFQLPYASFLMLPAIYFYYSLYLYQPYEVFVVRLPLYVLINFLVYGIARLLTGSKERAVLGTLLFFVINLILVKVRILWSFFDSIFLIWNTHPEALLIPIIIFPSLRLIKVGQGLSKFIHVSVFLWMGLLHIRLGARWIRNRYYYQIPPPLACSTPDHSDTAGTYPDIYCLVFDAFGHPDTLNHYLGLHLSFPDSLSQRRFIMSFLSLPYQATLPAVYHFLSANNPFASPADFSTYIDQKNHYNIVAHTYLPVVLRERGYYLTGPLPMYYALQSMACFEFYGYYNLFGMTFPYSTRWSHFAWNWLTIRHRKWPSEQDRPTFHYYHLLTSHYPYVFDTNGGYLRLANDNLSALRSSFSYTEKLLLLFIDEIREQRKSNPRPYAILIFSDHGPYELKGPPYYFDLDTARTIARSAWAALYASWELPDSVRKAFLNATTHEDLGRIILQIATPQ